MSPTLRALLVMVAIARVVVACSSAESTANVDGADAAASDAGGSGDASVHDGGGGGDAAVADASPTVDASPTSDAPLDAMADAANPLAPHPPPGATMCGHGAITSGDFASGCMSPSWVLDMTLQPDGGFASTPRNCGALAIGSGQWEAWCTSSQTYVWARFDQLQNQGTYVDCHNVSLLWIDEAVYDTGSSGGNGAHVGTYQMNGTQIVGTTPGMPQIGILEVTVGNTPNGGAAKLYVLGSLENTCNMGAPGPPTVFGGIAVSWMAH